jgi:hypothetical protein
MDMELRNTPNGYRYVANRRPASPRGMYVLAVSGVLGIVTFTLVYLSTLAFVAG